VKPLNPLFKKVYGALMMLAGFWLLVLLQYTYLLHKVFTFHDFIGGLCFSPIIVLLSLIQQKLYKGKPEGEE
jgi:hypothetical protein